MAECPWEALRSNLPDGAKTVLTALWRYAGSSGRFVWPSRETLAERCGMSTRTLRRHLAVLRERQWVTEARGEETRGNPGWHLCDPPGVPQVMGVEAATGEHDRGNRGDQPESNDVDGLQPKSPICRSPQSVISDRSADNPIRTEQVTRPELTANTTRTVRSHLTRNRQLEPTCYEVGSAVQRAEPNAVAAAGPRSLLATTFSAEFDWRWRSEFADGPKVANPAFGSRRLAGLQEALDEHGPDTVADVLVHAGHEVRRHLESGGRGGLDPRILAVAVRLESPSFGRLLDDWQRATRRKRHTGKVPAAPAELDGVRLTDEEQRAWLVTDGDVAARQDAVRGLREEQEARELVARSAIGELLGGAA